MKKLFFALLSFALLTACSANQKDKFAVYLLDTNQEIFSEDDLFSFDATTNTFTFTPEGAEKMKSYQTSPKLDAGLYQKVFTIRLGEEEIYRGKFWSNLSSMSENDIVITDVVMVGPDYNTLIIQGAYPGGLSEEKFNNDRLVEHFTEINKLVN